MRLISLPTEFEKGMAFNAYIFRIVHRIDDRLRKILYGLIEIRYLKVLTS